MSLFRNQYRIETTRLKGYDYTSPGAYFITICTYQRSLLFGRIQEGKMQLNEAGNIVNKCIIDLPNHYANLIIDE